jgi:hypothetical protein
MSTSLLFSLSHSLESLAGPSTVSSAELFAKVGDIWQNAWSPPRGGQDLNDKQLDAVKAVLEVVGRQLILSSLKDGTVSSLHYLNSKLMSSYPSRLPIAR